LSASVFSPTSTRTVTPDQGRVGRRRALVDRLRGPGESYSDVILRLVE
jgi:hypothetical protein